MAKSSQEIIDDFWKTFVIPTKAPTKASAVLPPNVYTQKVKRSVEQGVVVAENVETSYLEARKQCEAKVAQIVKECNQVNQKYFDRYFNLDQRHHCLDSLRAIPQDDDSDGRSVAGSGFAVMKNDVPAGKLDMYSQRSYSPPANYGPPSVKRIGDIFEKPQFFVDGANAKDIRQGMEGDCWFLSALAALCNEEAIPKLLEKVCVARDQDVGVYGFVLYRDGEWTSIIIDDKLYLRSPDYEDSDSQTRSMWENNRVRVNSEVEYRKEFQTNSRALYYAQSTDPNETWVPLLEKAFAKAHGDYDSISGGSVGEGLEDLTGGISTDILPSNILSKDKFWKDLLKVNVEFLFGCGTPNWDDPYGDGRDGIHGGHAYSILRAVEYEGNRLLLLKNPWGDSEWNGPWSDGSSQWTVKSIKDLGHTFGDDGVFWIPYLDMLNKYDVVWRTRLFSNEWNVTQQWTSLAVPWGGVYQDVKFEIEIQKTAPTVIVLSQLDDRYFRGLVGQYSFVLSFRLHESGKEDYIIRTIGEREDVRSVSVELDELEAGKYDICVKVIGSRDDDADKVEDVVKSNWLNRREKLLQTGLSYDLAHAKAQVKSPTPGGELAVTPAPDAKPQLETVTITTSVSVPEGTSVTISGETNKKGSAPPEAIPDAAPTPAADADAPADPPTPEASDSKVDPWAAVCVVGLRVYCKASEATIQILRPKEEVVVLANKLDVDDPARDATKTEKPLAAETKAETAETETETETETEKRKEKAKDDTKGEGGGVMDTLMKKLDLGSSADGTTPDEDKK